MTDQRHHKPPSERVRPNRHMGGVYRRAEVPGRKARGGTLSSTEDVVVQAVKLGYQIADEQIQRGQDIARRLRGASVRSGGGDAGELVDLGLRFAKQLAVLFVEWTETTAQVPSLLRAAATNENPSSRPGPSTSPATSAPSPAPPPPAVTVPVEVQSPFTTVVTVVLAQAPTSVPDVYPLFTSPTDHQPLRSVSFVHSESGSYALRVLVPREQPAGTYRGCAVDRASGAVLGTIAVEVKAP